MNKLLKLATTKIGCGYVLGSQGEIMTTARLDALKKWNGISNYTFNDGKGPVDAGKWVGKQCFDCSGLIVWSLQQFGLLSLQEDYTAAMLYAKLCTPLNKEQLKPGDLAFCKKDTGITHVGIYAGAAQVVEAKGTRYGVVQDAMHSGFNVFGRLKFNLEEETQQTVTLESILKECADDPDGWEKAVLAIKAAAQAPGSMGDMEIMKFLPDLLIKIYTKARKG